MTEQFAPNSMSLPPPETTGHIARLSRDTVAVSGFASAEDALAAGSAAFHGLRQYLAKRIDDPPVRRRVLAEPAAIDVSAAAVVSPTPFRFVLRFPVRLAAAMVADATLAISDALDEWREQRRKAAKVHQGSMELHQDRIALSGGQP